MKIHLAWIGTTLRLEARGQHLELRPALAGVDVVFLEGANEISRIVVDLTGRPDDVVSAWMEILDEKKRAEELATPAVLEDD
jgi:hypothetical protein